MNTQQSGKPIPVTTDDVDFTSYFEGIRESRVIRTAADGAGYASVMNQLENPKLGTPCALFANGQFRFEKGDVTLWCGINGHGKSLIVGQAMSQLMMKGERVFIMSLEMLPKFTFIRMMRQAFGHKLTAADAPQVKEWFRWAATKLVYFDKVGSVSPSEVLGVMAYVSQIYECKHIVIDNLMRVVSGEDDYNAQKNFVAQCCEVAMDFGVHVHLVHHVRKGEKETDEIGKFSIRGASSIADQAANIILIQRNLAKERKREDKNLTPAEDAQMADVTLNLAKHRNGDWQGRAPLWFCPASTAYSTSSERTVPRLWNGDTENLEDVPF